MLIGGRVRSSARSAGSSRATVPGTGGCITLPSANSAAAS